MEQPEKSEVRYNFGIIPLKPVGVVRNQSEEASRGAGYQSLTWQERAAKMNDQSRFVSELIINPDLEGILDGIDDFSHLMVLYWPHLIPDERRKVLKVHPLGSSHFPLVGTFATHSPARPNSILVTIVHLIGRQGNTLKVTGLDALNGSPILDIKPYYHDYQESENIRIPDWMKQMHDSFK
jgi:tRNA (adenine37-N6)-methyltransferase